METLPKDLLIKLAGTSGKKLEEYKKALETCREDNRFLKNALKSQDIKIVKCPYNNCNSFGLKKNGEIISVHRCNSIYICYFKGCYYSCCDKHLYESGDMYKIKTPDGSHKYSCHYHLKNDHFVIEDEEENKPLNIHPHKKEHIETPFDIFPKDILIKLILTVKRDIKKEYKERLQKCKETIKFIEEKGKITSVKCAVEGCRAMESFDVYSDSLVNTNCEHVTRCKNKECKIGCCEKHSKEEVFCCLISEGKYMEKYLCCSCAENYDWINEKRDVHFICSKHKNLKGKNLYNYSKETLVQMFIESGEKYKRKYREKLKLLKLQVKHLKASVDESGTNIYYCEYEYIVRKDLDGYIKSKKCDAFELHTPIDEFHTWECESIRFCAHCNESYCEKHTFWNEEAYNYFMCLKCQVGL